MKLHLTVPFAIFTTLITAAAATGNPLLYMLALMTVFTVVLCLAGVLWASATMQISAECEQETVYRIGAAARSAQGMDSHCAGISGDEHADRGAETGDSPEEHARENTDAADAAACGACGRFFHRDSQLHG